jgi:Family of unknown function (DUF5309)
MPFTGKATYMGGSTLPEIAEDVSDLISLNSPYETPLLDALGDPAYAAHSTIHEWLEDELIFNSDEIASITDSTHIVVATSALFRAGDLLRVEGATEKLLVTAVNISTGTLTIVRAYGGTSTSTLAVNQTIYIVGNAALEGADADSARVSTRVRRSNYTQIFSVTVEVSGSEQAVRQLGVRDELDYQKAQRSKELLRDLENTVINGAAADADPEGTSSIRRTMRGIVSSIQTNIFTPGSGGFPSGTTLSETQLNTALKDIWDRSNGQVDLLVMGGGPKRALNNFIGTNRRFSADTDVYRNLVSSYESDFGVCRVIVSRYVPTGYVLLLDSSRISVMPLAGRSFHYKPLASVGDRESGQLIGEYTLELRNQTAHGIITGLTG